MKEKRENNPLGNYDIVIVGAGPAGSTCALSLQDSNLKIALLDKSGFPRDKVCGDAIPARCERVLREIQPEFADRLKDFPAKVSIQGCKVVAPSQRHFDYRFHTTGYCAKRLDFDQFLLDLAKEQVELDLHERFKLNTIQGEAGNWHLTAQNGQSIQAKVLIACDGAQSIVAKELAGFRLQTAHHCAAVRAYYQGIAEVEEGMMEIHFLDEHLPGYFWIFPLQNQMANVGFGMLSEQVIAKKVNMRQSLANIVQSAPSLSERFAKAKQLGPIQGFGLPLGSRRLPLSGAGFLLCGDAASLIEPGTGEGIGNAMLSGQLAGRHIKACFAKNDFSKACMQAYDQQVYDRLWKGMRRKYLSQKYLGEQKHLMNFLVRVAGRPGPIRWLMKKVF